MAFYINNETLANQFVTEFELVDKWISCNTVQTCGLNAFGQLGLNNNDTQTTYQIVPKINNVQQVAAGPNYTLIVKATGGVVAYGDNSNGQLGVGSQGSLFISPQISGIGFNIKRVICSNTSSFAITTDNKLLVCGSNTFGQLGVEGDNLTSFTLVDGIQDVQHVACGYAHVVMLTPLY
jgi:alpha-tubulin suppressor-like RCC1 family protein